jgi:hypothetical protein
MARPTPPDLQARRLRRHLGPGSRAAELQNDLRGDGRAHLANPGSVGDDAWSPRHGHGVPDEMEAVVTNRNLLAKQ